MAPRRPQFVLSHSRPLTERGIPEWQGVAGWYNLTADPVDDRTLRASVQSFLLLSPLLSNRSTRPPAEQQRPRTAWTLLAAVAALLLTPSPAITSVVQIRSETPSTHATTRDKHALPPVRIRADQVFNTCPRADHGPVPTDAPEQRHLLSSRCLLVRPSDGAAGLRRGLVAPLLDNARCAGQTVRPTTELFFALHSLGAGFRAFSPLPMGASLGPAPCDIGPVLVTV